MKSIREEEDRVALLENKAGFKQATGSMEGNYVGQRAS